MLSNYKLHGSNFSNGLYRSWANAYVFIDFRVTIIIIVFAYVKHASTDGVCLSILGRLMCEIETRNSLAYILAPSGGS